MSINIVLNINNFGFLDHVSYMKDTNLTDDGCINPNEVQECTLKCGKCKVQFIVRIAFKFPYESSFAAGKSLKFSHVTKNTAVKPPPKIILRKVFPKNPLKIISKKDVELANAEMPKVKEEKQQINDVVQVDLEKCNSPKETMKTEEANNDNVENFPSDDEIEDLSSIEENEEFIGNEKPWWDSQQFQNENKCQICGLTDLDKKSKKEHLARMHPSECTKALCDVCGNLYAVASLSAHRERHFPSTAIHRCDRCQQTFNYYLDLKEHRRYCQRDFIRKKDRNFPCKFCSMKFQSQKGVDQHTVKQHPEGETTIYKCQECPYTSTLQRRLKSHMDSVHMPWDQRPFVCDLCGNRYTNKTAILGHMKITHATVRKFVCETCGASYKQRSALRYHQYKHTGQMPYQCNVCGKKFVDTTKRAEHRRRVHEGFKAKKRKVK